MPAEGPPQPSPAAAYPGALRVARIMGVPVYLTASWILLSIVLIAGYGPLISRQDAGPYAYLLGLTIVISLLVTVLLHELGHALAARRYRVGVKRITLEILGGFTELEGDAPTPRAEAVIALAGPGVSVLLAVASGAFLPVTDRDSLIGQLVFQLAFTNGLVAVFNALPGLPLDGGRALRAGVWRLTRDPDRADVVAGWSGRVVALATLAAGLALYHTTRLVGLVGLVFVAIVAGTLWRGASESIRMARLKKRLPLVSAGRMARPLFRVPTGTPLAEAIRRRDESGMESDVPFMVGVTNADGRVIALVSPRAVATVPPERRPWVSVDEVALPVPASQRIPAETTGLDVVAAVQANPDGDLLVTVGEDVVGVLRVADVVSTLRSREPITDDRAQHGT